HQGPGKGPWCADFSRDGRLLASASGDGIRLWDTATGKALAWLPIGESGSVQFHPADGSLLSCGQRGVYRLPVRVDAAGEASVVHVGPPQSVGVPPDVRPTSAALNHDGRVLAVTGRTQGQLVVLDLRNKKVLLRGMHRGIVRVSLSPDGCWVASSTW